MNTHHSLQNQVTMVAARGVHKVYPATRGILDVLQRPFAAVEGTHALRGIDLTVTSGEVFGLLGPNGAGKTTLQRILVNLVTATQGEIEIAGRRLSGDQPECRRQIGYVPGDERSFFWRLSGLENLRFFASLSEVPPRVAERRIDEYLEFFDLRSQASKPFANYSSGRKKLFSIIRGLIADPPILIFDEPTNALDPPTAKLVITHVRTELAKRRGRAVIWATHRLAEACEMCDRVMLIDAGRSRFCGEARAFAALAANPAAESDSDGLMGVFERLVDPR